MSVTRATQRYIAAHPSVKDCLKNGLINYSALSRAICREEKIKKFDAVLVACRRYASKVKLQPTHERKIVSLIRKARIRMVNKVIVAIIDKLRDAERIYALERELKERGSEFQFVDGEEALVVIASSDCEAAIREAFRARVRKVSRGLVRISMSLDQRLETTPGVVAFIYGRLAEHGINVLEEMSCWTDLMIVIAEEDAAKAMLVLGRVE